jgi:carbonic anhydrase
MSSKHLETSHQRIFDNNRRWVETMKAEDPDFFVKLGAGQNPEYLFVFPKSRMNTHRNLTNDRYIGCSDSRVPANQIMGLGPGEVFTTRNIANLVPNTDLSVMSVINYAVCHLKVKHIVVCGHYGCGGIKAAMTPADLGILNPWLRNIRDVYRLHEAELDAIPEDKRYERLVELNVVEQCRNVIKTAAVQQSYENGGFPIVHGWVFDIQDGLLRDLNVDFEKMLKGIKKIYNLSAADEPKESEVAEKRKREDS